MSEVIAISIRIPKYVRDGISKIAKTEGRSMTKQIEFILTKESKRLEKKYKNG